MYIGNPPVQPKIPNPLYSCTVPPATWWRGEDSNLRRLSQQIHSLPPLTAREPLRDFQTVNFLSFVVNRQDFSAEKSRPLADFSPNLEPAESSSAVAGVSDVIRTNPVSRRNSRPHNEFSKSDSVLIPPRPTVARAIGGTKGYILPRIHDKNFSCIDEKLSYIDEKLSIVTAVPSSRGNVLAIQPNPNCRDRRTL